MAATGKYGDLQQRHIPCDGQRAFVSKPASLFGRSWGLHWEKWRLQRQGKLVLAHICGSVAKHPLLHRSHCPHYRQSRASIVPRLIFPHCGKIAPLEPIWCERKATLGSGFIVIQFVCRGGTTMMTSALCAGEKDGRVRSSRKCPICATLQLVCRHGTRVWPKTNNQFGDAGTLTLMCSDVLCTLTVLAAGQSISVVQVQVSRVTAA
jgi:hypothetical protein